MSRNLKKERGSPGRYEIPLNAQQRELVEAHLPVVHWVIINSIHINETIYGFGYEDLFQEGCIWLCRAAVSYDNNIACFSTFERKVVRNGLLSYCRNMCFKQRHFQYLEVGENGELMAEGKELPERTEEFTDRIMEKELLKLLESCKQEYRGVARLGIEALEWKVKGLELKEIAEIYQVPSTYVGAWISRSAEKLRKNERFLQGIL